MILIVAISIFASVSGVVGQYPELNSWYCAPNCYQSAQGYNYLISVYVYGVCSNSYQPSVGAQVYAYGCGNMAQSNISGAGYQGHGFFAGYVAASTYSNTYYGNYQGDITKDCSGNVVSTGTSFGDC